VHSISTVCVHSPDQDGQSLEDEERFEELKDEKNAAQTPGMPVVVKLSSDCEVKVLIEQRNRACAFLLIQIASYLQTCHFHPERILYHHCFSATLDSHERSDNNS
jgi:hypothetical protein